MNVYDFLSSYFPPPLLGFFLGIGVGFSIGLIIGNGFFAYKKEIFRLRREDRLRKEQESKAEQEEDARQESRKAFYRECARLGLMIEEDVCFSADGIAYCPECYDRKKIVELVKNRARKALYCPECGFVLDLSHEC